MEDENQQTQPLLNVLGAPEPENVIMFPEETIKSDKKRQIELGKLIDIRRRVTSPDEDVLSIFSRSQKDVENGQYEDYMNHELNTADIQRDKGLVDELALAFSGENVQFSSIAQSFQDMQDIKGFYMDDDGFEQAMIDAQLPYNVEDTRAQRNAVKQQAFNMVAELSDKDGMLDTVWNGVGLLAPDYLMDVADTMDEGATLLGGAWPEYVEKFKLYSPYEQNVLVKSLIPALHKHYDGNTFKVMARVEELFGKWDAHGSHIFNVLMDLSAVGDVVAAMKAARAMKGINMAQRAADNEAIEETARLQALAAVDKTAEKVIGVPKNDAAHTLNPHNTELLDTGTSQQNIAGVMGNVTTESEKVVPNPAQITNENLINNTEALALNNQRIELEQLRTLIEQRMKVAAEDVARRVAKQKGEVDSVVDNYILEQRVLADEKPSRGALKSLIKEKEQLSARLQELKAELKNLPEPSAGGTKKSREALAAPRIALNDQIDDIRGRIGHLQRQLDATKGAVTAEGNLARMRQGAIPEELQKRLDELKERIAASKAPKVSTQARTSQIAQGVIPDDLKPAVKAETEKQLLKIQEEARLAQEPPPPVPVAPVGAILPKAAAAAQAVRDLMKIIKAPILKEQEWALAEKRAVEKLQGELAEAGTELNSIDLLERGHNFIKVKYRTVSGEGEHSYRITKNDVGQTLLTNDLADFQQKFVNEYRKLFSKETLLRSLDSSIVENTTFAGNQTAIIKNKMRQLWDEAEAGLSKKELEEIDAVLMMGDQEGLKTGIEEYTIAQLRSGSLQHAGGNVIFTPRQIESYYTKRAIYRELHDVMNTVIRDRLEFEGYESFKYNDLQGVARELFGRKRENFDLRGLEVKDAVFFPGDPTRSVHVGAADVIKNKEKYKELGYRVVELAEPHYTKSGSKVSLALIKDGEGWGKLPGRVLNYSPGYIPRIYRPGYFFVRNEASETRETLYAFDTKAEAEKWAKDYRASGGQVSVWKDGEFGDIAKAAQDAQGFGGLVTGNRKLTPLKVMTKNGEQDLVRMSVGQATERYMNQIAKVVPINEYRMSAVQRWENDATAIANAKGRKVGIYRFDTPDDELNLPTEVKSLMLETRQYIREVMGVAPAEESITEGFMLGVANLLHGKKVLDPARDWVLNHSKGSVQSWLKGHAFDLRLGWFNPRQIFVQAQNAQIAMLLEPTHALPALGDTLKLRTIALLPEDKAMEAAKAMGFDKDTIESLLQYNKSGLKDAIKQNADYEVHRLGIAHNSLDVIRKARKVGRVFYEEGENFSRLVSWSIARRKWKLANPNKVIDDEAIKQITMDSQSMVMNMQSENAAWWQRAPVLGMATQFMQVQAKFLENVMPRVLGGNDKWTRGQKLRVLSGQLFLYGAVGVPLVEEAASYVASLTGQDPQEFIENNPEWVTAINEGLVGTFNSILGGDKTNISEGMSLLGGFDETLPVDVLKAINAHVNGGTEETGFVETLSGPTTTTLKRFGDVVSTAYLSAAAFYQAPTLDVAYGAIMSNADSIASMTSTWSNAKKAYVLNKTGKLFSADGKLIATEADLGEMSLLNTLRVGMGFKTDVEVYHWAAKISLKEQQQIKRSLQKDLEKVYQKRNLYENEELFKAEKAFIMNALDPWERIELNDKIIDQNISPAGAVKKTNEALRKNLIDTGRSPSMSEIKSLEGQE